MYSVFIIFLRYLVFLYASSQLFFSRQFTRKSGFKVIAFVRLIAEVLGASCLEPVWHAPFTSGSDIRGLHVNRANTMYAFPPHCLDFCPTHVTLRPRLDLPTVGDVAFQQPSSVLSAALLLFGSRLLAKFGSVYHSTAPAMGVTIGVCLLWSFRFS